MHHSATKNCSQLLGQLCIAAYVHAPQRCQDIGTECAQQSRLTGNLPDWIGTLPPNSIDPSRNGRDCILRVPLRQAVAGNNWPALARTHPAGDCSTPACMLTSHNRRVKPAATTVSCRKRSDQGSDHPAPTRSSSTPAEPELDPVGPSGTTRGRSAAGWFNSRASILNTRARRSTERPSVADPKKSTRP